MVSEQLRGCVSTLAHAVALTGMPTAWAGSTRCPGDASLTLHKCVNREGICPPTPGGPSRGTLRALPSPLLLGVLTRMPAFGCYRTSWINGPVDTPRLSPQHVGPQAAGPKQLRPLVAERCSLWTGDPFPTWWPQCVSVARLQVAGKEPLSPLRFGALSDLGSLAGHSAGCPDTAPRQASALRNLPRP